MRSGSPVRFRCPDCGTAIGPVEGRPACRDCGRVFGADGGVWNLLPTQLHPLKLNEDAPHADEGLPTWRRLFFHKRHWLEACETRWLPTVIEPGTRTFLEIGGGLCYASALAKARAPSAHVVATDVSPRYLRHHALRVGAILGASADTYAAVDAEALPFEDAQFDAVYSQVVLYRLPEPGRALREIWRVLAPGGRYLGIERASPWLPPFREGEARAMRARAVAHGIGERPIRYREWQRILREADLTPSSMAPVPGRRLRAPWLSRLGNAARPIYVSIRLTR